MATQAMSSRHLDCEAATRDRRVGPHRQSARPLYNAGPMDLQLNGKVAVVTGASRGLGSASAAALAAEGCRVAVCARGEAKLTESATSLRAVSGVADRILPIVADVSSVSGVEDVV